MSQATGDKGTFVYLPRIDTGATNFYDANGGTAIVTAAADGYGGTAKGLCLRGECRDRQATDAVQSVRPGVRAESRVREA